MSLIRRNVVANFIGKFWAVLVSLAAIPFLLRMLGIEAFGVVGVYMTLVATATVLDFGMGTMLNRSLAELSVAEDGAQRMGDLARTVEVAGLSIALLIALAMVVAAPAVASNWIVVQGLPHELVEQSVALMGLAVAAQWPLALYSAGLSGLQQQVTANVLASSMATVRNIGAIVVLWAWEPSLVAFFLWHLAVNLVEMLAMRALFWRALPRASSRLALRPGLVVEKWRFAVGVGGISVLAVILTQLDKLILSKLLTLEDFGYYTLAWRVASGLFYLVSPIMAAFFPRFTQLAALEERSELERLYHTGCQLTAVAVIPLTVLLAMFPDRVLLLWTNDATVAAQCSELLRLLSIGTAINGLMNLPLALQLAFGWTRLVFSLNAIAVLLLGPLTYMFALRYGARGAAWVWIALNCGYVVFMLRAMHRRLLPGRLSAWFIDDIGRPLAATMAVALPWKLLSVTAGSYFWMLAEMSVLGCLLLVAGAFAAPRVRPMIVAGAARLLPWRGRR